MSYKCKKCGRDVSVIRWPVESGGVDEFLVISVETASGKFRDVDQCPTCGNRLMVYDDIEFIPPGEYHREDERTAAI